MNNYFFISVPKNFNFWKTVYSHGWCGLRPFHVDVENKTINRLFELTGGILVYCVLSETPNKIKVNYYFKKTFNTQHRQELIGQIKRVFRLDEDFNEFFNYAKRDEYFKWVYSLKAGRLLRSPTIFEDVVKLICTTNCSWSLTEIMTENLTTKLGKKFLYSHKGKNINGLFSFPTPDVIASVSEKFLRSEIKCGYRAPYILELAHRISSGNLDLENVNDKNFTVHELFKYFTNIKGVGPYAAANILKLMGKYEYLGIDSWCRMKFFDIHKNGRKVSDAKIESFYSKYGKWKGLFFWLDVTKDWYKRKIPF